VVERGGHCVPRCDRFSLTMIDWMGGGMNTFSSSSALVSCVDSAFEREPQRVPATTTELICPGTGARNRQRKRVRGQSQSVGENLFESRNRIDCQKVQTFRLIIRTD
jgi:hypothetical protein